VPRWREASGLPRFKWGLQARELDQLRADSERERDEILARLTDTAQRLSEVTTARAAELERVRADAACERDELRAALESRAQVLEESRDELPNAPSGSLTPRGPS
jgi:hypothetical protein